MFLFCFSESLVVLFICFLVVEIVGGYGVIGGFCVFGEDGSEGGFV